MTQPPLTTSETSLANAMSKMRTLDWPRLAILYTRFALGAAFLSGIASRFGLYSKNGYGNFANFMQYTAEVNSFMPAFTIPFLAWAATAAHTPRARSRTSTSAAAPAIITGRRRGLAAWAGAELPPAGAGTAAT